MYYIIFFFILLFLYTFIILLFIIIIFYYYFFFIIYYYIIIHYNNNFFFFIIIIFYFLLQSPQEAIGTSIHQCNRKCHCPRAFKKIEAREITPVFLKWDVFHANLQGVWRVVLCLEHKLVPNRPIAVEMFTTNVKITFSCLMCLLYQLIFSHCAALFSTC